MKVTVFLLFTIVSVLALVSAQYRAATDVELTTLSEALYLADTSNFRNYVTINTQEKTSSPRPNKDAPLPLLQVDERVYTTATVAKLRELFNSYENEHNIQPDLFLDAVLATPVMRAAMTYLQGKGIVTSNNANQKEMLKTLWFTEFRRGQKNRRSSGFKHVFTVETKTRQGKKEVLGLHNWLFFAREEQNGNVNYKEFKSKIEISPGKMILSFSFDYTNINKRFNTMFIGTSPELELALYTICFYMRKDAECPVKLNDKTFSIRTIPFTEHQEEVMSTAFPVIPDPATGGKKGKRN